MAVTTQRGGGRGKWRWGRCSAHAVTGEAGGGGSDPRATTPGGYTHTCKAHVGEHECKRTTVQKQKKNFRPKRSNSCENVDKFFRANGSAPHARSLPLVVPSPSACCHSAGAVRWGNRPPVRRAC